MTDTTKAKPGKIQQINDRLKALRAEIDTLKKEKQDLIAKKNAKPAKS
ncbi:hypothetical protein [Aquisalinus flavus]|nr:hypothetical protein [Aquisalinus flavus]MBD0425411.1 hypothetical protein [Aquisalinus flavus]